MTEVLQIEKLMNKYTSYDLSNHLRGSALDRLKDKFAQERDRIGPEEAVSGIALHNPLSNRNRKRSSNTLRKEVALTARLAANHVPQSLGRTDPVMDQESKTSVSTFETTFFSTLTSISHSFCVICLSLQPCFFDFFLNLIDSSLPDLP
jgi:hypothetical protein